MLHVRRKRKTGVQTSRVSDGRVRGCLGAPRVEAHALVGRVKEHALVFLGVLETDLVDQAQVRELLKLAEAIQAVAYELIVEHVRRKHLLADHRGVWQEETCVVWAESAAFLQIFPHILLGGSFLKCHGDF